MRGIERLNMFVYATAAVAARGMPSHRRSLRIGSGLRLPTLEAEAAVAARTMAARPEATLTVATWNVWFDRQKMEQRYSALLRTLLRSKKVRFERRDAPSGR